MPPKRINLRKKKAASVALAAQQQHEKHGAGTNDFQLQSLPDQPSDDLLTYPVDGTG